jgi:hypothetical protein
MEPDIDKYEKTVDIGHCATTQQQAEASREDKICALLGQRSSGGARARAQQQRRGNKQRDGHVVQ